MTPAREPRSQDQRPPVGRHGWALDGMVALGAAAAEVGQVFGFDRSPPVAAVVLAFVAGAVLLRRRREPLHTLVSPAGIAPLIALYTVATMCERRVSLVALALTVPIAIAATLLVPSGDQFFNPVAAAACSVGAWGLGLYVETRRKYRRELERRAAFLEREREQLARLAAHEERAETARELHDIVVAGESG